MLKINNVATSNDYTDACTLKSERGGGRLVYLVANASAIAQFRPLYDPASAAAQFEDEVLVTASSGQIDAISGVRFKSAVAGTPARIIATLSEPGDVLPSGGNPFTSTLQSSGGSSPAGTLNGTGFTPADPAGIAGGPVMMGLGATIIAIPAGSFALVAIVGDVTIGAGTAIGGLIQIRFGTGAAPANGAAPVGTALGSTINAQPSGSAINMPFAVVGAMTGLTAGTTYWVDLTLQRIGASSSVGLHDISATILA